LFGKLAATIVDTTFGERVAKFEALLLAISGAAFQLLVVMGINVKSPPLKLLSSFDFLFHYIFQYMYMFARWLVVNPICYIKSTHIYLIILDIGILVELSLVSISL